MKDPINDRLKAAGLEAYANWTMVIERNQRNKDDTWTVIRNPYMMVDGRVRMAIDEHKKDGKKLTWDTPMVLADTEQELTLLVKVHSEIYGTFHGIATSHKQGSSPNERQHPWETAETSAIGRCLGVMGYGLIPGSGIASAEDIQRVSEDTKVQPVATAKPVAVVATDPKAAYYTKASQLSATKVVTAAQVQDILKAANGDFTKALEQLTALDMPKPLPADDESRAQRAKSRINAELQAYIEKYPDSGDKPMTDDARKHMFGLLSKNKVTAEADRHAMFAFLFEDQSTKGLTTAKVAIISSWLAENPGEVWPVIRRSLIEQGQKEIGL